MKNFLKKAAFLLMAILIPFIIANEVVRWTWKRNFPANQYFVRNWQLSYSLRPNFHKQVIVGLLNLWVWKDKNTYWDLSINSQGIRHPKEISPRKAGNDFRIICLGDSVTFGQDVDDRHTYSSQLEQILRGSFQDRVNVEVINAGVPGYTSRQGLVYFSTMLAKFSPDLLILEFGLNDMQHVAVTAMVRDKKLFPGDIRNGFKKMYHSPYLIAYLIIEQPLFSLIRYYGSFIAVAISQQKIQQAIDNKGKHFQKQERSSSWFKDAPRVPLNDYFENLTQFLELANRNHCRILIYLPYGLSPKYKKLIMAFAYENKIPVVDFSQSLTAYKYEDLAANQVYARLLEFYIQKLGKDFLRLHPEYLLTVDGGHPNAVGNRIIAEGMAGAILVNFFNIPNAGHNTGATP